MAWDPVFSPDGRHVVSKVEKSGKYAIAADGRTTGKTYDRLWNPMFSPDGKNVLLKYVENEKYYRQVTPLTQLL
jgi:hypothetical protein